MWFSMLYLLTWEAGKPFPPWRIKIAMTCLRIRSPGWIPDLRQRSSSPMLNPPNHPTNLRATPRKSFVLYRFSYKNSKKDEFTSSHSLLNFSGQMCFLAWFSLHPCIFTFQPPHPHLSIQSTIRRHLLSFHRHLL